MADLGTGVAASTAMPEAEAEAVAEVGAEPAVLTLTLAPRRLRSAAVDESVRAAGQKKDS